MSQRSDHRGYTPPTVYPETPERYQLTSLEFAQWVYCASAYEEMMAMLDSVREGRTLDGDQKAAIDRIKGGYPR